MLLVALIYLIAISMVSLEAKAREIKSGQLLNQQEVLDYLKANVPQNSKFFADNPIYTLLGNYQLNQPLVHIAPSFASVFNYQFICNQDYLILTHRQSFLNEEEQKCIQDNYSLKKRFVNVGESFVEVWKSKNLL